MFCRLFFSAAFAFFRVLNIPFFFRATAHLVWSMQNLFKTSHSPQGNLNPLTRFPGICTRFSFPTFFFSHEKCDFSTVVLFFDYEFSTAVQIEVRDLRRVSGRLNRNDFIGNCWLFLYLFHSRFRDSSRLSGRGGLFYIYIFVRFFPSKVMFILADACQLFSLNIMDSVFYGFGLSLRFLKYSFNGSRSSSCVFS